MLFLSVNIIFLFFLLKLYTSAILVETTGIPKDKYSFNLQALTEFVKSFTTYGIKPILNILCN